MLNYLTRHVHLNVHLNDKIFPQVNGTATIEYEGKMSNFVFFNIFDVNVPS